MANTPNNPPSDPPEYFDWSSLASQASQSASDTSTAQPNEESFIDNYGDEWTGIDRLTFSGHGKVTRRNGIIEDGDFKNGGIINGKRVYPNNSGVHDGIFYVNELCKGTETYGSGANSVRVEMTEGNNFNGKGRKEYFSFGALEYREEGTFIQMGIYDGKRIFPDGRITTFENGNIIHDTNDAPSTSTTPSPSSLHPITQADFDNFFRAPSHQSNHSEPIPSILESASYENVSDMSEAEKEKRTRGIERVEALIKTLSEEDQRRIGELRVAWKSLQPEKLGMYDRLRGKKPSGKDNSWRVFHLVPGSTTIEIDPRRLPPDDTAIISDLIGFSKHYRYLQEVEGVIRDSNYNFDVNLELDYGGDRENAPFPNFKASIEKVKRIRNIIAELSGDEKSLLSRTSTLVLLSGQRLKDYKKSHYKIIISCDSLGSDTVLLGEIRARLKELDEQRASARGPSGKPNRGPGSRNKPSTGGIFSSTRNKVLGALAGLTLLTGGGIAAYRTVSKPAPVASEPEAPKPPTKSKAAPEADTIKKIDLSKIPVGGKVTFKTLEDGVKMGVVMKDGDSYIAIDKFDLVDRNTAIRLQ